MAYSRYRRKPRRSYRKSGPKRRYSARPSRYTAKTRRYTRKRPMSKRAILNTTSKKKRDTMLPWTNMTAASQSGSTTYTTSPAVINGGSSVAPMTIWCATARDLTPNTGPAAPAYQALRTATTCYMKGLSENVEIQISDGLPWQWRRICFTSKSLATDLITTPSFSTWNETSLGIVRTMNQPTGTNRNTLESYLFKGTLNVDWNDQLIAPVDTLRVTVLYDKVVSIASGNESGTIRKYRRYLPLNKNLVYDDDENGDGETQATFSVGSKAGMGDLFVVDIFRPRNGSTSSNQLSFGTNTTLYWHEK
uniref:Capsid protein n=1 Tax=Plant associated genomovirus 9 TaxID=2584403 RepID=A0A4Y5QCI6_9VIRU|nr:capsid protein [Plant associated genomovirus 9]